MPIVKELSRAAAAPGSPPILGRAAQEIIRQGEEIERLQEVLRTIAFRAQDAKRLCEEGAPISAYNLASGILGQIGGDVAVLTAESRQEAAVAEPVVVDMDGARVKVGDTVAFGFGIPPQRVEGNLVEEKGDMHFVVTSPDDVKPRRASLRQLRAWGIEFHKVGRKDR